MDEDLSLISIHPLVRKFVLNIVQDIRLKKYSYEAREVVHADMVPKVSERVMQKSMGKGKIGGMKTGIMHDVHVAPKKVIKKGRDMSELIAPLNVSAKPRVITKFSQPITPPIHKPIIPNVSESVSGFVNLPPKGGQIALTQDYGKIMPLLNDATISTMDCPGPDKPIFVVRMGQREITKISLNVLEIKELLEKLADVAHVPLMEGVFRISVDGMTINAVISEMLGTKFVIKKATAYNLLE